VSGAPFFQIAFMVGANGALLLSASSTSTFRKKATSGQPRSQDIID
jgi:hypothetical protein